MYSFNAAPTPTTSIDYIMDFFDDLEKIIEKFEEFRNLCDEFEDFNDPNIDTAARKYVEVKNKLKELCEYHPIEKKDDDESEDDESEDDDEMEDEGEGNDKSGDSDDNAMHQKDAEDVEGSDDDEDKCSGCDKCCLDNFLSPFKDYVMTLGDGGSLIFLD